MVSRYLTSMLLEMTLAEDGCTILNPFQCPCVPVDGFMVGIVGVVLKFAVTEDTEKWHQCINAMVSGTIPLFIDHRVGIGTWVHGEGDKMHIHLDTVMWVPSEARARMACITAGQLTYWNVKTGESYALAPDHTGEAQSFDAGEDE